MIFVLGRAVHLLDDFLALLSELANLLLDSLDALFRLWVPVGF